MAGTGELMDFSEALRLLKQGNKRFQRSGWNGKGMWIRLNQPSKIGSQGSHLCLDYLEMWTADGKLVPWLASQTDLLAEDWQEFQG